MEIHQRCRLCRPLHRELRHPGRGRGRPDPLLHPDAAGTGGGPPGLAGLGLQGDGEPQHRGGRLLPERGTFDVAEPYSVYEDPLFRYPFILPSPSSSPPSPSASPAISWRMPGRSSKPIEIGGRQERLRPEREAILPNGGWSGSKTQLIAPSTIPGKCTAGDHYRGRSGGRDNRKSGKRLGRFSAPPKPVFPISAWPGLMEDAPVNRAWRDLHTACFPPCVVVGRRLGSDWRTGLRDSLDASRDSQRRIDWTGAPRKKSRAD